MKPLSMRTGIFLQILKKAKHGTVHINFPDGAIEKYGEGLPLITVSVKKWEVFEVLFTRGDIGLAESIIAGDLEVDDAVALVQWACLNDQGLAQALHGTWLGNLANKLRHLLNYNDRKGAKKNIVAHYDLGNEFYNLWLDKSMTYSSAIFQKPDQDIYSAQLAKYDRIIDSLQIKSGDHVLEIGCGWGGFFSRAVERTGCKVTAVMNSPEQARYNSMQVSEKNMKSHVNLLQQDYRDINGRFDKIVSIEMIEAVGEQYWDVFFQKVGSSLKSKGGALIQGITIREDLFYSYRKGTDFIQKYVFPGGMLLTNNIIREKSLNNNMNLTHLFEFGQDYAETLKIWRKNFNDSLPHVKTMGFDDSFVRMWDLYLAYCEGAFRAGRINVGQFLLER